MERCSAYLACSAYFSASLARFHALIIAIMPARLLPYAFGAALAFGANAKADEKLLLLLEEPLPNEDMALDTGIAGTFALAFDLLTFIHFFMELSSLFVVLMICTLARFLSLPLP